MVSDFDLQKYKYIQVIAEEKSISKAANRLYLSQPYLSKLLAGFENSLNVVLFERSNTSFKITPAGKIFLDYIEKLFALREQLMNDISLAYGENITKEHFCFGISPSRSSAIIPKIFMLFSELYPNTQVEIKEAHYSEIMRGILNRSIHIGMIAPPEPSGKIVLEPISEENLLLVIPSNHPLGTAAARAALNNPPPFDMSKLELLSDTPCVTTSDSLYLGSIVKKTFANLGFSPSKYIEINSLDTAMNLVLGNAGFGLFPSVSITRTPESREAFYYTIGSPPIKWQQVFCYRKGTVITPAMRKFMQLVTAAYLEAIKN